MQRAVSALRTISRLYCQNERTGCRSPEYRSKRIDDQISQGGERTLIYAVTGREINSSMLPADAGCIVDNVETICSIYDAVALGRPIMKRIFTVTGKGINRPAHFEVCTGTDMAELIDAAVA